MDYLLDDREYLEPPDFESKAVLKCSYCDGGIFEDEDYYVIEGNAYCEKMFRFLFSENCRKTVLLRIWGGEKHDRKISI